MPTRKPNFCVYIKQAREGLAVERTIEADQQKQWTNPIRGAVAVRIPLLPVSSLRPPQTLSKEKRESRCGEQWGQRWWGEANEVTTWHLVWGKRYSLHWKVPYLPEVDLKLSVVILGVEKCDVLGVSSELLWESWQGLHLRTKKSALIVSEASCTRWSS